MRENWKRRYLILLVCALLHTYKLAAQFTSITNLDPVPISQTAGEKPQAKVWQHAGKYWAVLSSSDGTHLWRLDGSKWTIALKLSNNTTIKADCMQAGDLAHILLFQGRASQLVSIEYNAASGTYELWSKRKTTVGLDLDPRVETATIDMNGRGRMWVVSDGETTINARWSDSPYHTWSAPITVAAGVLEDDIGAVIALPGKIGVFWSNQRTKRFGFRTHADGEAPENWSEAEVPAAQSALNIGFGMADDHMNLEVAGDGTLYCAVKTSYENSRYPEIALLVRRPNGSWDDLYEVSTLGTRPIVILDESQQKVAVAYTASDKGGNILYKESSTSAISFGEVYTLLEGSFNNATSSKENSTDEIVVLASSTSASRAGGVLASTKTELKKVLALVAFPNPFQGNLQVQITSSKAQQAIIKLYNAQGSVLHTQQLQLTVGQNHVKLTELPFSSGIQFLSVVTAHQQHMIKLIRESLKGS